MKKVVAIIQASGMSKRMGEDKLPLRFHGKALYQHILDTVSVIDFERVLVISRLHEILDYASERGYESYFNAGYEEGQSRSIRLALEKAPPADGYMFFVADQPFISVETIHALLSCFERERGCIVLPIYKGRRGSPGLFDAKFKLELLDLKGDQSGRDVIRNHTENIRYVWIDSELEGVDIDTREDYLRYRV